MRLRVISDYGSTERIVTEAATPADIRATVASLDWQGFHQVVLDADGDNWFEAGGSLDPNDGLSLMFEENGRQLVVTKAPTEIDTLISAILQYLAGTGEFKTTFDWA